jgi:thiol-disulfide isomerase/thioredoxin
MKIRIKKFIFVFVLCSILLLGYQIVDKIQIKKEFAARIKELPDFSLSTLEDGVFTQDSLKVNARTIFVYFNSECDFCISEAQKIQERLSEFINTQLIFTSFENVDSIKKFAKTYALLGAKNVVFLEDRKMMFSEIFNASSIPTILVYDENRQLIKKFKGLTKVDALLNCFETTKSSQLK